MAWIPKFCVVSDFTRIIPNQRVKFMIKQENEGKDGKIHKNMVLTEDVRDITIMPFDGAAMHCPEMSYFLQEQIPTTDLLTSIIFRMPLAKGCSHEVDFKRYGRENGIEYINDMWGQDHKLADLDMILTESTFKASKFFKKYGDYRDFEDYLMQCEKYEHTFVVTKWAEQPKTERIYTRANYQILQDLELPYEEFAELASYSKEWGEQLSKGFDHYVWSFAGLTYKVNDETGEIIPPPTDDNYFKAILKNPLCLNDSHIRKHITGLADKYFNEFCCGKVFLRGAFKFIVPDVIAFLQHCMGQEVKGALKAGEMWSKNLADGVFEGECILERNPHIAKSEHTVLNAVGTREIELTKYAGHLNNAVIINTYDDTTPRLSGCDMDGDLSLVIQAKDHPVLLKGIDRTLPTVINIDEKVDALKVKPNDHALIEDVLFGSDNRIGEYSNCATKWNNKVPSDKLPVEKQNELKKKFDDYINLISIINAKEIDSAKTHIKVNLPYYIQKYAGHYPYFMKYAGSFYASQTLYNFDSSNMNLLCFEMEKWKRNIKWKRENSGLFNYEIYLNTALNFDNEKFNEIEELYKWYGKERKKIYEVRHMQLRAFKEKWFNKIEKEKLDTRKKVKISKVPMHLFKFEPNYKEIEIEVLKRAKAIEPIDQARANYAVTLCYGHHPNKFKNFAWIIAGEGIVKNVKQVDHQIPMQVQQGGDFVYLGKQMAWVKYPQEVED